jgi:hypothetical protein
MLVKVAAYWDAGRQSREQGLDVLGNVGVRGKPCIA